MSSFRIRLNDSRVLRSVRELGKKESTASHRKPRGEACASSAMHEFHQRPWIAAFFVPHPVDHEQINFRCSWLYGSRLLWGMYERGGHFENESEGVLASVCNTLPFHLSLTKCVLEIWK